MQFAALIRWLSLPRARVVVIPACIASVILVAAADVATGPIVSLALLYLAPVMALTWVAGRKAGVVIALTSGLAGLGAFLIDSGSIPISVGGWNAAVRTMIFLTVVWLVDSQRHLLQEHYSAAMIDGLTGVMTRRAFYTAGERLLHRAERRDEPVSLLYADLDRLKQANDNYGHEAGDEMIVHFARVATGLLRDRDLIARIGGDEFVILQAGVGAMAAVELAERLTICLLEDHRGPALTASIGVASRDGARITIEELVRDGDDAMYEAKRAGGAGIRLRVSLELQDDEEPHTVSRDVDED